MAESNRVIGREGKLPWHIPADLKHFSQLTTGHTVLMGRKTYQSLPEKFRPLPNRQNVVVTRLGLTVPNEVLLIDHPRLFIESVRAGQRTIQGDTLWIIGGAAIYAATADLWDGVELTLVSGDFAGDAFMPQFEQGFEVKAEEPGAGCRFVSLSRVQRS